MAITTNDMNEQVVIQRATATRDAYNAEVLSWETLGTVWAKVTERGGREPMLADRPIMLVSYEVIIRSGVTVTHYDQLQWRGKTLAVQTVTPLRAEGMLLLRCLEVDATSAACLDFSDYGNSMYVPLLM